MTLSLCACRKELKEQMMAGYIAEDCDGQTLIVDSMGSGTIKRFMLDDQTIYEEFDLVAGNIVEVAYMPTDEGQMPSAIAITTNDTYPKVLGRWKTRENERLGIEIDIKRHGKIEQTLPEGILEFTSWQLLAKEDTIRLFGTLSLPPEVIKAEKKKPSKEAKEEEATEPARRTTAFTAEAVVGRDGDSRTLTIITDKGAKSTLYQQ